MTLWYLSYLTCLPFGSFSGIWLGLNHYSQNKERTPSMVVITRDKEVMIEFTLDNAEQRIFRSGRDNFPTHKWFSSDLPDPFVDDLMVVPGDPISVKVHQNGYLQTAIMKCYSGRTPFFGRKFGVVLTTTSRLRSLIGKTDDSGLWDQRKESRTGFLVRHGFHGDVSVENTRSIRMDQRIRAFSLGDGEPFVYSISKAKKVCRQMLALKTRYMSALAEQIE
jgi:hypothetical protein